MFDTDNSNLTLTTSMPLRLCWRGQLHWRYHSDHQVNTLFFKLSLSYQQKGNILWNCSRLGHSLWRYYQVRNNSKKNKISSFSYHRYLIGVEFFQKNRSVGGIATLTTYHGLATYIVYAYGFKITPEAFFAHLGLVTLFGSSLLLKISHKKKEE